MTTLLALGFLLGLKHALEADHLAAVAALSTRRASLRERAALGSVWGLGHALTLFGVGTAVLVLGFALPAGAARVFEAAVGVLLVALGLDVLRRARRERIHVHAHRHEDGALHLHAHAHARDEGPHDAERHRHEHAPSPLPRALLVGGVHGLAGSAVLLVLATESAASTGQAFLQLAAFSTGSIAGMTALSLAISVPLAPGALLGRLSSGLQHALGIFSVALGAWIALAAGLS